MLYSINNFTGGFIMKKVLLTVLCLMVAFSLIGTGCGQFQDTSSESGGPKVLRLNNMEEPGSLHPQKAQGTHDSWVLEHIFEGLTKKSVDGKIIPGMAEKWDISKDGLTYKFYLRKGITWSNGEPVTAADFEYAWKFCLNPATASDYAFQLYYLKGGEAYNTSKETDAAKLKALEDAVGIKVIDDGTFEVVLAKPTAYFLELLSFYTYYPINKKAQEANPNWFTEASSYVSNGAFKLTEWKHKESIKIEKNENYYDKKKVKLTAITFAMLPEETTAWQMYKNDTLDVAYPLPQDVTAQLNASKDKEFVIGDDLSTYFYRFNTTKKPFTNAKVRKALAMAIDRKSIIENVAQGGQRPAFGFTPPGIADVKGDYQKNMGDLFKENVDEAKKLLAEGLKEEGMDKLSFTITYNTSEGHKRIAEAIQEMWRKNLGAEVKLENVEFQVKIDREHKLDYDVSRSGWIGDYIDPMTFLDMFLSDSTMNDTGWKNADYDKLIKEAQVSMDQKVRMKNMHEAEKILMNEMPFMPIYFYTKPYTQKSYVTDVYKPVNRYPQFHYADIKK
jgi:oligopeptide transport system substrate-binding protein